MNQEPIDTKILIKQCREWIKEMKRIIASKEFNEKMKGKATAMQLIKSKVSTIENQLRKNNYKKLSTKLYEFNQRYAEYFK